MLVWLLEHGVPEAKNLLPLPDDVTARSSCECGCPSVEFNLPQESSPSKTPRSIVADFTGISGDLSVGVILFAQSGVLAELEVYAFDSTDHSFGLPPIETLRPFS